MESDGYPRGVVEHSGLITLRSDLRSFSRFIGEQVLETPANGMNG